MREIEVVEDHRAHHDAVQVSRDEEREGVRVDGLKPLLLDALADTAGEDALLLVIELPDLPVDDGNARFRSPVIEADLHEFVDRRIELNVIVQPIVDDIRRVLVTGPQLAEVFEGLVDGVFDGGAEQVFLAVEVIVDQGGIDAERARDVLDGHGGKVALGEEIEGNGRELLPPVERGVSRRSPRPAPRSDFLGRLQSRHRRLPLGQMPLKLQIDHAQ